MEDTERGIAIVEERSIEDVRNQVNKIQDLMKDLMKEGEHYGIIPGTTKPTLYKAGAEKLCFVFRLTPEFEIKQTELARDHREIQIVTTLRNMVTGAIVGQGLGSCSTMESKYRWRKLARVCPRCGKESIIKGKEEYGGGWLCYKKKDGCGAKFADDDQSIIGQPEGRIENDDIADCYNTVLKISKKRSIVDATITACAASDIFTQDVEDMAPEERNVIPTTEQFTSTPGQGIDIDDGSVPAPPPDPAKEIRDKIKTLISEGVALLGSDFFFDDDRVKFKAKIAIKMGATEESLAYTQTVINEYKALLEERKKGTPLENAMAAALRDKNAENGIFPSQDQLDLY